MASVVLVVFWIICTLGISFAGALHIVAPNLPQYFNDLLLYGKVKDSKRKRTLVSYLEVPKSGVAYFYRWFIHFYVVGFLVNGWMTWVVGSSYLLGYMPPTIVSTIVNALISTPEVKTDALSALLVVGMMFLQNTRRLYECLFVSVYSKGTMNLLHYALGIALYSTFSFAVIVEAPDINTHIVRDWTELFVPQHLLGVPLFLWASYQHHKVHEQLANLRKDEDGKVVTTRHRMPVGGWFDYVSCPHYFFEILIYVAFYVTVGMDHRTLFTIFLFVLDNQLVAGYITHMWYRQAFSTYPLSRRAVIPYIL